MGLTTIFDAMAETVKSAKRDGKLYYLYLRKSKGYRHDPVYFLSHLYWDDWLFKAYPGGRKILSIKGNDLVKEEKAK